MVAGGRVVLRRAKMDDDDDEYVVDEEGDEEEEEDDDAEAEPEPEDQSDPDEDGEEEEADEDLEIDAPGRPSRPRGRGGKAKPDEDEDDDDDSDADFDGGEEESEDEEDLEVDAPRPRRRPAKVRRRATKRKPEEDSDADFEEELEIDTRRPRARRPAKVRRRALKRKPEEDSDADFEDELEIDTPAPRRPTARRRARKAKPPHDESDADFDGDEELDDEGFEIETPRPKRVPTARSQRRAGRNQEDESDADFDGEDDGLENDESEVEVVPWPKRPPTVRSRRRREVQEIESDADFKGDEEELENDELEVETPQSATGNLNQGDKIDADFDGEGVFEDQEEDEETPQSVKYSSGDSDMKQEDEFDADFNGADEEVEDQEEVEELEMERPQSVKYHSGGGRNLKHEDDFDADFNGAEEEFEDKEEDELETETRQPRYPSEARGKGRKVKPAGSSRQRHEDDDDYAEEIEDEDEDFDPEVDGEEEDEEEDVEEDDDDLGDYAPTRATKVRPRNHLAKRKPAARHQHRKRKSGSRVSKGKTRNGMSARRRRRKRLVADDCEGDEEEDDDEDFVVDDDVEEEVNYRPRKKAKDGRKTREGTAEPVAVGEAWPSVESDTSEFEFVTSEEEHAENEAPVAEPAKVKRKKGRRKKGSESDSSSDSDYIISEEELKDLGVPRPQETVPLLPPHQARRTIVHRRVDGKGKEPKEALKQICGICLSEEQRATIQGVLNCCSHYFCFACILEWSKVESKCPLCKRRFNAITKSSVTDLGLGLRNAPVRIEKRDQVYQPTEDEMRRWLDPYENVVCIECNQGGDDNLMLLCDICDSSAHTFCVGLGREVPEGNWYCGGCRSSVDGPSYAQTQERVVHLGESNMNIANSSPSSFGRSISSGVFQRPPPINVQPSLQGFDLNLSPIETPEEDKRAESHISAEPVSTPTGRHATLDRRRALNRRIRILLFRPRTATNAWQNSVQHDRSTVGTDQNQRNTSTSTDLSPSCSRADFTQSQQNSSHFVQSASNLTQCSDEGGSNFREVENAKDQLIPIVKKSIKNICAQSPLDQSSFTNVARRATHTILALSGIAHNRDRVVATPFPFPSHCCHACDGREPAFLMRTICSSCFNLFVGDVVSHIAHMFS